MARKIINQTTFASGEVSPEVYSRSETSEYGGGLETATNVQILSRGPIRRRNGSLFIAEVKDSSTTVKLVRFQFSQSTALILEFGNLYIRFFTNNAQVLESDLTITGITAADPGVVTSTSHGLSDGDHVYITGVVGMTEVNSSVVPYLVNNKTANTFELQTIAGVDVDTSAFTAYSSGGVINRIYEIVSPYSTAQIADIQFRQKGSTIYVTHTDITPQAIVRTSNASWTIGAAALLPPPTYESGFESTGVTMTPAATTGIAKNFTASGAIFLAGDVGRQIINLTTGETGRASIVSITSTTVAVCDIVEDFTDTNAIASDDWKIDLTPVVALEFDAVQAGAIANVRSEYIFGSLGPRKTITGVTGASPAVVTSASHGFVNGETVQIQDIVGMTQINDKTFTVESVAANTFELKGEDSTGYTAYASGGIARRVLNGVVKDTFRAADVSKYILINGGVAQILTVNAADDVDVEIMKTLNSLDTSSNWSLEAPTWNATRGFPRAVGISQQRLIFGGTIAQPQTVWMSETGIFEGYGAGPDDEDAVIFDVDSDAVNEITWIANSRDLTIGTSGGEMTVTSGTSGAITPSAINPDTRTPHGSKLQQVVSVSNEILFLQGSDRKIRTFRYNFNIDGYEGEDLTYLGEHITEGGLKELIFAQEPDNIIYAVTNNGDMIAGTYDRSKKIIGFSKYETDGSYENVQTITKDEEDQVWVVVKRTINGATKRYIELFIKGNGVDDIDGFSDSYLTLSNPKTVTNITVANPGVVTATSHGYSDGDTVVLKDLVDPAAADLDSAKTNMTSLNQCVFVVANKTANTFELTSTDTSAFNAYGSGGNAFVRTTAISGLDHLEAKTVQIKVDGGTHADKTVSSGAITLDVAAGEVVIGLPYTSTIKTLGHEFDIGMGSMQGQRARWVRPLLRVYRSARPTVNGEFLPSRSAADFMDKKVPLFSGFLEYGSLKWDNTTAISIVISDPLPLEISGIVGVIDSEVR